MKNPTHPRKRATARAPRRKVQARSTRRTRATKSTSGKITSRARAANHSRAANAAARARTAAHRPTGLAALKPPTPEKVVAAIREELERLTQRWKSLLPKLQQSNHSVNPRTRRAPGGSARRRTQQ